MSIEPIRAGQGPQETASPTAEKKGVDSSGRYFAELTEAEGLLKTLLTKFSGTDASSHQVTAKDISQITKALANLKDLENAFPQIVAGQNRSQNRPTSSDADSERDTASSATDVSTEEEDFEIPLPPAPPPPPPAGFSPPAPPQPPVSGLAPPPPPPPGMPNVAAKTEAIAPRALTFGEAKTKLQPIIYDALKGIAKGLAKSDDESARKRVTEFFIRNAFKDSPLVSQIELDSVFNSEIAPTKTELKVIRQLADDISKNPDILLKAEKKAPAKPLARTSSAKATSQAESIVDDIMAAKPASTIKKSSAAKEIKIEDISSAVTLYLAAQGKSKAGIDKVFEKDQNVFIAYKGLLAEVKKFCADNKLKIHLNDPKEVSKQYSEMRTQAAVDAISSLHIAEEELNAYLDATQSARIANDPMKALPKYQELKALQLWLFDKGSSVAELLPKGQKAIYDTVTAMKEQVIADKMKKDGLKQEDAKDALASMGAFLESYQETRHSTTGIPSSFIRAQKAKNKAIYELNDKEFETSVAELKQGRFPSSLRFFLGDSFAPSHKLLERLLDHIKGQDAPVQEKMLSTLSPIQQLWLLETCASDGKEPMANTIAQSLALQTLKSLQSKDNAKRAEAIKLFAYINENQQKAYAPLLDALKSNPAFERVQAYV